MSLTKVWPSHFAESLQLLTLEDYGEHLDNLQINELKTAFKFDTIVKTTREKMMNAVIDLFSDQTGIDPEKSSNYVYDGSLGLFFNQATVVTGTATSTGIVHLGMSAGTPMAWFQQWTAPVTGYVDTVTLFITGTIGSPGNLIVELYDQDPSTNLPGNFLAKIEIPESQVVNGPNVLSFHDFNIHVEQNSKYWLKLSASSRTKYNNAFYLRVNSDDSPYPDGSGYYVSEGKPPGGNPRDAAFLVDILPDDPTPTELVSVAEDTDMPPTKIFLATQEDLGMGSIAYYVSRDDGVTWTPAVLDGVTDVSGQPPGTKIRIKAVLNRGAKLLAWGYAWV